VNKKLAELLQENKNLLEIFKDKKTLDAMLAMKGVLVDRILERGDIRLLILDSLATKPKHGYQIITSMSKRFAGLYKPSAGAVYPTLQALSDEGMIEFDTGSGKKVYSITKKGDEYLKRNRRRIDAILSQFKENFMGGNEQFSKSMENLVTLWAQLAYEVFYNSRIGLRNGDADLDKRMRKLEKILGEALKGSKEVWK
jgi:DNA-binding PadR family transcriptional regulator